MLSIYDIEPSTQDVGMIEHWSFFIWFQIPLKLYRVSWWLVSMDNQEAEDDSGPPVKRRKDKPKESCVIHFDGIVHGAFKLFSNDEKDGSKNPKVEWCQAKAVKRTSDILLSNARSMQPYSRCHYCQSWLSLELLQEIHWKSWPLVCNSWISSAINIWWKNTSQII